MSSLWYADRNNLIVLTFHTHIPCWNVSKPSSSFYMMYWYCNFIYYKPLQLHILINDIEEAICKYNEGVGLLLRIFAVLIVTLLLVDNLSSCFLPKLIARNVSVMIDPNYYRHTVENYFSNRQMLHCNWYLYNFVFYQNISLNDRYFDYFQ